MSKLKRIALWLFGVIAAAAAGALVLIGLKRRNLVYVAEKEWANALSGMDATESEASKALEKLDADRRKKTLEDIEHECSSGDLNSAIDALRR